VTSGWIDVIVDIEAEGGLTRCGAITLIASLFLREDSTRLDTTRLGYENPRTLVASLSICALKFRTSDRIFCGPQFDVECKSSVIRDCCRVEAHIKSALKPIALD
jgi:hypothetical protein